MSSRAPGTADLHEAARKLIGAYMADEDLAPHVNALEAAAGFRQQGAEPPDRAPGTDTAPSDEAVRAAAQTLLPTVPVPDDEREQVRTEARIDAQAALTAAYAIDMPRREAKARAEERAEIVARIRHSADVRDAGEVSRTALTLNRIARFIEGE